MACGVLVPRSASWLRAISRPPHDGRGTSAANEPPSRRFVSSVAAGDCLQYRRASDEVAMISEASAQRIAAALERLAQAIEARPLNVSAAQYHAARPIYSTNAPDTPANVIGFPSGLRDY